MLKLLKKYFNFVFIFHKMNFRNKYINFYYSFIYLILFYTLVYFIISRFTQDEQVFIAANKVFYTTYFLWFIIFTFYQATIDFYTKNVFKNKRRERFLFFSKHRNYLGYCIQTSFFMVASIAIYITNYILYNEHPGGAKVLSIMLTAFIIMFSLASLFWFAYIIIYRLLDEQTIKSRLNLYMAIASTVNLIQLPSTNSFIISFSVIIVAYRWIIHFIDDRKTWRKSKILLNTFCIGKVD